MNLDDTLETLARNPLAEADIAEVALLLARDEFPRLDVEGYLSEFDAMAQDVSKYLHGDLPTRTTGLCRYLFHELGFHGNTKDYYDPQNSYLNIVLERRTGIPISLSAVVIAVGQRAGMKIYPVGLPGHFIIKTVDDGEEVLLDPFHGGRRLTLSECENLVSQVTGMAFEATAESVQRLPLGLMVQRMLNNLKAIYLGRGDFQRGVQVIGRLQQLDPDNALHERDLGACRLRLQQPGRAIDHLQSYLKAAPNAEDVEDVERLLKQARRDLAERN